ncbi:MAG: hypothetical protein RLZZ369_2208, partial [Pseudomonadota bacterium]
GVTFQQLSALPKALGRQNAINQFLSTMQIEWSSAMSDAERAELTKALTQRPEVRDISGTLRETAIDFQVTQIYLTDPFGTIIADSLFETAVNNIGGNRRTRRAEAAHSFWSAKSPRCRGSIFQRASAQRTSPQGWSSSNKNHKP